MEESFSLLLLLMHWEDEAFDAAVAAKIQIRLDSG